MWVWCKIILNISMVLGAVACMLELGVKSILGFWILKPQKHKF